MKRTLSFMKYELGGRHITERLNSKKLLLGLCMMSLGVPTLKAQTSLILPNNYVAGSFIGPLTNTARTYQLIIDDSQLISLAGKYLSSISFRLPDSATANWPAATATFPSYEIFLSNSVEPVNRQLDFAANIVGTQTQVRTGSLIIPTGAVTSGNSPNNFSYEITFDSPYLYTAGNNLLIEVRHTGSNGTNTSVHALGTTDASYGTLYSACWKSTGNVLIGNVAYIKINSLDNLGVQESVEINPELSVYPNPVKDYLYIQSTQDIAEFHIYNVAGQKIYSQKGDGNNTQKLNLSSLPKGNYIIQTKDKKGNINSKKFIKE